MKEQVKISNPAKFQRIMIVIYSGNGSIFKSLNLIEFIWLEGKSCPPANFSIQILLIFLRFEVPPNFMLHCHRPQTWQFYFFFPALFISGIHKVPGIKFKGG